MLTFPQYPNSNNNVENNDVSLSLPSSNNNFQTSEAFVSPDLLIKGNVCGYCNGVFLCCSNGYTSGCGYFMYDPFTKESTHIPILPEAVIWKKHSYVVGFNSEVKDFGRVFLVVLLNSFIKIKHEFRVNVFSSEIGEWRQIVVLVKNGFAFVPHMMFGFAYHKYICFMGKTKILVLDLDHTKSDSHTMDYPEGVDGLDIMNFGFLGRSGGYLRIGYIGLNNELKVWEWVWSIDDIADETNDQFWYLIYETNLSLHLPTQFCDDYFKHVAGFHPYDMDLVYLYSSTDGFFVANLKTNKFEHVPGYDNCDISPFQLELPVPNSLYP